MPGWSLWLLPPKPTQITYQLDRQIREFIPQIYSDIVPPTSLPIFPAHITLTSLIPPLSEDQDAQAWLDSLPLEPKSDSSAEGKEAGENEAGSSDKTAGAGVQVQFKELASGSTFFKRLYIRCHRTPSLLALASLCRRHAVHRGTQTWAPVDENVQQWVEESYDPHISLLYVDLDPTGNRMELVNKGLRGMGIMMAGEERKGMAWMEGWRGGRVWLVPTDRGLGEWRPVAERVLKG